MQGKRLTARNLLKNSHFVMDLKEKEDRRPYLGAIQSQQINTFNKGTLIF